MISAAPAIWSSCNGTVIALAAFVRVGLAVATSLEAETGENRTSLAISTASRHKGIALAWRLQTFTTETATAAVLLYHSSTECSSIIFCGQRRQPWPESGSRRKRLHPTRYVDQPLSNALGAYDRTEGWIRTATRYIWVHPTNTSDPGVAPPSEALIGRAIFAHLDYLGMCRSRSRCGKTAKRPQAA